MGTPRSPHLGQPVLSAGAPLESAKGVLILLHGRGASAGDMLSLISEIDTPGLTYLAPQAAMHSWWPQRFIAPVVANEPWFSSALEALDALMQHVLAGIAVEKVALLGFSQGAVLAAEYAARNPRRYGGILVLSGGLFGPDDEMYPYSGSLAETPVFLGCSDVDLHIPLKRVQKSAEIFRQLGGVVTERIYPGMGHIINEDEIGFVRDLLAAMVK